MKRLKIKAAIILICICGCLTNVISQQTNQPQIGFKAGLNLTDLYFNSPAISDLGAGFNVGIFLKMPLSKVVSLQPELYLTTKGASIKYNAIPLNGSALFNLTYIELPVLCLIQVSHHINLQAGIYAAYLADAKVSNRLNTNQFDFEQYVAGIRFNRTDAGLIIGAGILIRSNTIGIRYSYGLVKVGTPQGIPGMTYFTPDATNGVLNFYLSFPLFHHLKE